jgi:hypothetical protein
MEHTAAKISNILEQTFIKNIKFHVNLDVQVLYISFYFLSQVIDIRSKTACRLYRATRELLFHEGERLGKDKQIAGVFTQFMQYLVLNCDYSNRYSIVIVQALVGFLSLFNEVFCLVETLRLLNSLFQGRSGLQGRANNMVSIHSEVLVYFCALSQHSCTVLVDITTMKDIMTFSIIVAFCAVIPGWASSVFIEL